MRIGCAFHKNLNNFRINVSLRFPNGKLEFRSGLSKHWLHELLPGFWYSLCTCSSSDRNICAMLHDFCAQQSNDKKCNKISSCCRLPARFACYSLSILHSLAAKKCDITFWSGISINRVCRIIIDPTNVDKCTLHEYLSSI